MMYTATSSNAASTDSSSSADWLLVTPNGPPTIKPKSPSPPPSSGYVTTYRTRPRHHPIYQESLHVSAPARTTKISSGTGSYRTRPRPARGLRGHVGEGADGIRAGTSTRVRPRPRPVLSVGPPGAARVTANPKQPHPSSLAAPGPRTQNQGHDPSPGRGERGEGSVADLGPGRTWNCSSGGSGFIRFRGSGVSNRVSRVSLGLGMPQQARVDREAGWGRKNRPGSRPCPCACPAGPTGPTCSAADETSGLLGRVNARSSQPVERSQATRRPGHDHGLRPGG